MNNPILTDKTFTKAVNLSALIKTNQEVISLASKGFRKSVDLGRLIHQAHQVIRKTDGINLKEFCHEVFGWNAKSSQGNRYSKIGIATDEQVNEFESLCAEDESKWKLTIVSFKAWLEGKDAKESTKEEVIFTLSFKGADGNNVSVRITESGEVKTSNAKGEIAEALEYLKECYNKQSAKAEAEAKAEATTSVVISDGANTKMIEKRAIAQAEAEERKNANAERVKRESVDEKHFVNLYNVYCNSEGLKFDKAEYKAWRRKMVLAYREWFGKSKKNNAYLGAYVRKMVNA